MFIHIALFFIFILHTKAISSQPKRILVDVHGYECDNFGEAVVPILGSATLANSSGKTVHIGDALKLIRSLDAETQKRGIRDLERAITVEKSKPLRDIGMVLESNFNHLLQLCPVVVPDPAFGTPISLVSSMGGFIFGCIAAYFLFLWYVVDIGDREKYFTEENCEKYEFGPIRGKIFPVYEFELAKLLPLAFLMVCSVFVYSAYRFCTWYLVGWGFAFGNSSSGFIGDTDFLALDSKNYSLLLFQFVFVAAACTIVSGAVAGRCYFSGHALIFICMTVIIYPVIAFAIENTEGFLHISNQFGVVDFAGSGVVHIAGYLLSVAVLQAICGKWKLNIGFLMFGYNLAAFIISGWMFLGFWNPFIENWKKENYDLTLLYDDPQMKLAQGMQWMYLFFYWTKYIEYADTLWTILKGRLALNPRCCLQVYQHLVAPAIVYLAFYRPSASTCLGGITNSFVHTIMYGYWAGTYLCKEKWFKKLGNNVFYLQMTQFSIILIQKFTIVSIYLKLKDHQIRMEIKNRLMISKMILYLTNLNEVRLNET